MFRKEMSKSCLTAICGMLSVGLIIGGTVLESNADSPSSYIIGQWLLWTGIAATGATLAYTGVHCLNFWNETVAIKKQESIVKRNTAADESFFDEDYSCGLPIFTPQI